MTKRFLMEFGTIYIRSPHYLSSMPTHVEVDGFAQRIEQDLHARHNITTEISARLFNIGNIGREAFVRLKKPNSVATLADVMRVAEAVADIGNLESGDIILHPLDDQPEIMAERSIRQCKVSASIPARLPEDDLLPDEACADVLDEAIVLPDLEIDEADRQLDEAENTKRRDLELLRAAVLKFITEHRTDPKELMRTLLRGKYILRDDGLSRLTINRDLKIILPDYDELEICLTPLAKAIYILFLQNPDGIVLKNISDYSDRLRDIYNIVMPGRSDDIADQAIDNVCSPLSDTLRQNISRIKRAFSVNILDKDLAAQYFIDGHRGAPYRIALKPSLITLPAAFSD